MDEVEPSTKNPRDSRIARNGPFQYSEEDPDEPKNE